jgi:hypothetical protein
VVVLQEAVQEAAQEVVLEDLQDLASTEVLVLADLLQQEVLVLADLLHLQEVQVLLQEVVQRDLQEEDQVDHHLLEVLQVEAEKASKQY